MTANPYRGEVEMPEAGEGAVLRYTLDCKARLEKDLGPDLQTAVFRDVPEGKATTIKAMILVGLKNVDKADKAVLGAVWDLNDSVLGERILDAWCLSTYGRNLAQQREHDEAYAAEQYKKQLRDTAGLLEEFKDRPLIVAGLLSRLGLTPHVPADSVPTSSGD